MTKITINEQIAFLRKQKGLTQEELAKALGVTNQAISKWESAQCCPDIQLLPDIAKLFDVSVDELLGLISNSKTQSCCTNNELPWEDDGVLRIVVFKGNKILSESENIDNLVFRIDGEILNVVSYCNLECGNIQNGAQAYGNLNCKGSISGGASCKNNLACDHSISGGVSCGNNLACGHSISGGVNCGNNLSVGSNIDGDVQCTGEIHCHSIKGNVECKGNIIYN